MIINDLEFTSFSTGSNSFSVPKNPRPFSSTISTNEVDHLRQIAEHKQLIIEYETYHGCLQATQTKLIQAIDPEWLAGLCSDCLGFTHHTLIKILNHLRSNGATLDDVNIQELISTMYNAWNLTKNPSTKLALFKAAVKRSGTFDPAIQEWKAKPKNDQTFTKFCPFIVKDFAKNNTRKLTAQATKHGIANNMDTATPFIHDTNNIILETTAELFNAISTQNNKKLDNLIKLLTETLAAFQKLLHKNATPTTTTFSNPRQTRKSQCPCKHHHPNIPTDKYWELPANVASHPAHWKSLAECNAYRST
ncbi:hypothetical protein ACHAW6_000119 [Cyclotella cf. meneghiniana]